MVFVCGILEDGILYAIDSKYYSSSQGAQKRCEVLNGKEGKRDWIVLYQDQWKVFKG